MTSSATRVPASFRRVDLDGTTCHPSNKHSNARLTSPGRRPTTEEAVRYATGGLPRRAVSTADVTGASRG